MNIIIHLLTVFAFFAFAEAAISLDAIAQKIPTAPQQKTTSRICSFNAVDNLLPPPQSEQTNSPFSYLAQESFTQISDGSWVCYVSDPDKEGRYYTLFKVQQINGKLVVTSFLENGRLIDGQDNRTLDLFMMLIQNQTKTTQGNRQSIRRYLETFISLVKQGKIEPSRRGYLFDQPSCGFAFYSAITGKLQGTAIAININPSPKKVGCAR